MPLTPFRALAAPVDASTGDRRRFAENSLTTQPLPMPGRWQREDIGGHDGAVSVASISGVEMEGEHVWVEGHWFTDALERGLPRLAEDVAEAMYLAEQGVLGFSVDLDDAEAMPVRIGQNEGLTEADLDDPELEVEMLVTKGRIRSATLVAIPAFVETNHTIQTMAPEEDDTAEGEPDEVPDEDPELAAVTATVAGATGLPVAEREAAWDGGAAAGRVFDAYSDDQGMVNKAQASRAFLWVDGDGKERGDYKLGFADIIDGELRIVPRGVAATAGGRGVDATKGIPAADQDRIKSKICSLYAKVRGKFDDWPECPFDKPKAAARLEVTERTTRYLAAAFVPPVEITGPTPMTYDWDRLVAYGHIALRGTCHTGFKDVCVLAPIDESGEYPHFNRFPLETEDGPVFAGRITVGGRHAPLTMSAEEAVRVYDDKHTVAYPHVTTDQWGIFACGPLRPDVDAPTREVLSRRKVSGDWRERQEGLALMEILALPPGAPQDSEPGFPIQFGLRAGRQIALTASFSPPVLVDAPDVAEMFRATAVQLVREELDRGRAMDELRARLSARAGREAAIRRENLARLLGA